MHPPTLDRVDPVLEHVPERWGSFHLLQRPVQPYASPRLDLVSGCCCNDGVREMVQRAQFVVSTPDGPC